MAFDKEKYKKELESLKGEYQKTIILPGQITFGPEIEFVGADLNEVYKFLEREFGRIDDKGYKTWRVKKDTSTTRDERIIPPSNYPIIIKQYGGEVISPILQNDEKSWDELSRAFIGCVGIENFGFDDNCAFHVHFGKDNFNNEKFIANLFKAYMIFEDIIFRTCYGETNKRRPDLKFHATLTAYYIYNSLKNRFDDEDKVEKFLMEYSQKREYGLNLKNYTHRMLADKYTIEIRCANHLKSRFLMQNTIRFLALFLLYCDSDEFDDEFMDYYIKRNFRRKDIDEYEEEDFEKAMLFAQIFIKNEQDRLYFMKQYLKCYQQSDIDETQKIKLINQ